MRREALSLAGIPSHPRAPRGEGDVDNYSEEEQFSNTLVTPTTPPAKMVIVKGAKTTQVHTWPLGGELEQVATEQEYGNMFKSDFGECRYEYE